MNTEYFYSILIFFGFIFLTVLIRLSERSWTSPAFIFSLLWVLVIGVSLISAPSYYFSPTAIGFIMAMAALFFVGGYLARSGKEPSNDNLGIKSKYYFDKFFAAFLLVAIFSGFISILFLLKDSSITINAFSKTTFRQLAEQFTRERYSGIRLSSLTMLFLMINYSGCILAGWMIVSEKERIKKFTSVFIFLPLIIFTLIYTARATLLFGIILFGGGVLAGISTKKNQVKIFSNKLAIVTLLLAFILIPVIFIITQASRMGIEKFSLSSIQRITDYLKVWFAGNISAFSIWFDASPPHQLTFGQFTFAGVFELLNISRRELGIYSIAYDVDGKMAFTNVYTVFRFLIDDFGIIGTSIGIFISGYAAKRFSITATNGSFSKIIVLAGIFSFILFSFVTSIWAYNTILFAWLILVFVCFFIENTFRHAG